MALKRPPSKSALGFEGWRRGVRYTWRGGFANIQTWSWHVATLPAASHMRESVGMHGDELGMVTVVRMSPSSLLYRDAETVTQKSSAMSIL